MSTWGMWGYVGIVVGLPALLQIIRLPSSHDGDVS
jgi:hypothetical protein